MKKRDIEIELFARLNELETQLENDANAYSEDGSKWLQGYDQRVKEEANWLKAFIAKVADKRTTTI